MSDGRTEVVRSSFYVLVLHTEIEFGWNRIELVLEHVHDELNDKQVDIFSNFIYGYTKSNKCKFCVFKNLKIFKNVCKSKQSAKFMYFITITPEKGKTNLW